MYLQLTTRCNMRCDHCGLNCSPDKGKHMDDWTFTKALELCSGYSETITFGGGEPTCHPRFKDYVQRALDYGFNVWMATNGKKKTSMWWLFDQIDLNEGKLSVDLSLDSFHERIDPDVRAEFVRRKRCRYGSDANVLNVGRAKKNGIGTMDDCICETTFIDPDGKVWQCGCQKVQIGTVWGVEFLDDYASCSEKADYNQRLLPASDYELQASL